MGMELLLVRLTPAQQEAIAADPELLDLVFPEGEQAPLPGVLASLDIDADTLMESYLDISAILDESVDKYEWMRKAANGTGTTIRFGYGYEDVFVLSPERVAEIAAGLDGGGVAPAGLRRGVARAGGCDLLPATGMPPRSAAASSAASADVTEPGGPGPALGYGGRAIRDAVSAR
jgi:hypothetical protein